MMFVYAIGGVSACKVGITKNVDRRLQQIQHTSWETMSIKRSFSVRCRKSAAQLEFQIHKLGKEIGFHLTHEWFKNEVLECFDRCASGFLDADESEEPEEPREPYVGRFYTLQKVQENLADRKLMLVSAATGIHRNTLAAIRDGENDNPSLATMTKLSEYFTGQMQ